MSMDEVHVELRELVTARFYSLAQAFADIDYAGIGVVSKEDFKDVVRKHLMRLSDEQVIAIGSNDYRREHSELKLDMHKRI